MSEAELHIIRAIRARLDGGIRNKAARGELRRGLPVGQKDVKCYFIQTKQSSARFGLCLNASLHSVPRDAFGFGSGRNDCLCLCTRHRLVFLDRFAGCLPLTPPSITSSRIRYTRALILTARPSVNATSMNTAPLRNACADSPCIGGRFSSRTVMRVLSIEPPISQSSASIATLDQNRIRQEAL